MHLGSVQFQIAMVMVKEEMHLQENTLYGLTLVSRSYIMLSSTLQNHMTYAPAKFKVATSNSLGEDAFTRKYIV